MLDTNENSTQQPQPEVGAAYDVVVMGGGPAGATAATLIAEGGQTVLLLDRAPFPRFHVGESLIPETYWTLKRLGLIERLKQSAFPKKFSVQFVGEEGKESAPFYFDEYKDHESSQTWQVWRADFDQMLIENAVSHGVVARTDAQVLDVLFDDAHPGEPQATGVRVKLGSGGEGSTREIAAKVVVDASGQSAFLATRLGLKKADPQLKKGTVWTYFEGALRDTGRDEGATLIMQSAEKSSWFWYIPLPDGIVSVGCTGDMNYMFRSGESNPADIFARELGRCPGMQRRLANATRCRDYHTTKDFSYHSTRAAGPNWVLVGDAFGFIDPVYSSGVHLALKSGEFAADAVLEAFQKQDFSAEQLGNWREKYVAGVELFRKLVYAFYTPNFSFGQFLRVHPQYRTNLVDILIGDVFKPGVGDMFDAMGDILPPTDTTPTPAM